MKTNPNKKICMINNIDIFVLNKNLIEEFIAFNFKATKIRIFPFRLEYFKNGKLQLNLFLTM